MSAALARLSVLFLLLPLVVTIACPPAPPGGGGMNEGVGEGTGEGVGEGMGEGVGEGAGEGVGEGTGEGLGEGVGEGVGEGAGEGAGEGVGEGAGEMANPLTVFVNTDPMTSVSDLIFPTGGSLTTTGADGTVYMLTIPDGALAIPRTITMTPIESIDGFPLSLGLAGGVDLQPEGLRLLMAATLTIMSPIALSGTGWTGFGYQGTGEEFHLYPMEAADSMTLVIQVDHFSGVGAGQGTPADHNAQQGQTPTSPTDQALQDMAEVYGPVADRQINGGDPELTPEELDQVAAIMRNWFNNSVLPDLKAAETNDALLEDAKNQFLTWLGNLMLRGFDDCISEPGGAPCLADEVDEGYASLTIGLNNAIRMAFDRCVNLNDPTEVQNMMHWAIVGQALGLVDPNDEAFDLIQRCVRFELEFTSSMTISGGSFNAVSVVHAIVPLTVSPLQFNTLMGSGPLTYQSHTISDPPGDCTISTTTGSATFEMRALYIDYGLGENAGQPEIVAALIPGTPSETFTVICPDDPPLMLTSLFWTGGWVVRHIDDLDIALGYIFKDWTITGGMAYASREIMGTTVEGDITYTELTTMTLTHTPAAP